MVDWNNVPLKQITTKIGSGATPRGGKEAYKTTGITLIRSLNVYDFYFDSSGLAFLDDEQADGLSNVVVEPQDVLLNITGASVARCCMVPSDILPARVNQHVAIVRVDKEKASPQFVFYTLVSPTYKHHLLSLAQGGATREALTKSTIEDFEIPLPPLETQHRIAAILSAYDGLIENNTRRITLLEQAAHDLYREWFVEFRFPGHESVEMVDSGTEYGEIPQGLEVVRLKDLTLNITSGGTPRTTTEEYWNGGIPWLSSGETRNHLIISTEKTITELGVKESSTRHVEKLSTVIASAGQGKTRGQTSLLMIDTYINQSVLAIISDPQVATSLYIFLGLSSRYDELRSISDAASSRGSLTKQILNELPFLSSPKSYLDDFDSIAIPIYEQMYNLVRKNNALREARDLLLPRLVSGQLDVEDVEILTD